MHRTITATPLSSTVHTSRPYTYTQRRLLYRVIVTVCQQFADSFALYTAHKSAWRLCVGRIVDPPIVRALLSCIDSDLLQERGNVCWGCR
jgi:hypothetical protein